MCYKTLIKVGFYSEKDYIFNCFLASSLSFGADWRYAASTDADSFWVDKSFYKYDSKTILSMSGLSLYLKTWIE